MYMKISKVLIWAVLSGVSPMMLCSCSDDDTSQVADAFDVQLNLPQTLDVVSGSDAVVEVLKPGCVQNTDIVYLENVNGIFQECPVTSVTDNSFSFSLPEDFVDGTYRFHIRRGDRRKNLGQINIRIVDPGFEIEEGTTVFGVVKSAEGPIAGVVVSDGSEVTVTNELGQYQLKSQKPLGYVFVSVPSGYEPKTNGVFPKIYTRLLHNATTPEMAGFEFTKVDQSKYKVLFLGDMHLANRTGDLEQFAQFTDDLNAYRKAHSAEKVYGITLGDMSWDVYWYSNNYALDNYVATVNEKVQNLMIYHTIGNHDNDYKTTNNRDAKTPFCNYIAPDYYSFNIGGVHYVVLDDIDCSAYDGTESRNYTERIPAEQIVWLQKDLSYVSKSTPLVIMMHAPLYYPDGATQFKYDLGNHQDLLNAVDGYSVQFVTGHTHKNYNVTPSHNIVGGKPIYEHNVAAVCADWWWSGHLTPGVLLAPDGTPAGYAVWDIDGTDMQWLYKGTGMDENVQFRTYDLNKVSFTMSDVPNLKPTATSAIASFKRYCDAYPANSKNEVLINVWNYNPAWTVTVTTQNGAALTATPVTAYDPLHIAAMSVKRFNSASITSAPNFITQSFPHFFKVTAPDADTDLVITVKDEFGHTWTENMARPKDFSIDAYKTK